MAEVSDAIIDELVPVVAARVPDVVVLVPAGPAAMLGRLGTVPASGQGRVGPARTGRGWATPSPVVGGGDEVARRAAMRANLAR